MKRLDGELSVSYHRGADQRWWRSSRVIGILLCGSVTIGCSIGKGDVETESAAPPFLYYPVSVTPHEGELTVVVPLCAGDKDVDIGVVRGIDGLSLTHGGSEPRTRDELVNFEVSTETIRSGRLTSVVPVFNVDLPPNFEAGATLSDLEFIMYSSRGYDSFTVEYFDDAESGVTLRPQLGHAQDPAAWAPASPLDASDLATYCAIDAPSR